MIGAGQKYKNNTLVFEYQIDPKKINQKIKIIHSCLTQRSIIYQTGHNPYFPLKSLMFVFEY